MIIDKLRKLELERNRLEALHKLELEDNETDPELDRIVKLASHICNTPISLINLIDANQTFFKASVGTNLKGSPREISFCSHAIKDNSIMEVPDATNDERFMNNPLVTGDTNVRFYAGAPLITNDGYNIGTLCVFDAQPKKLDEVQLEALETLARQVVLQIELKQIKKKLGKENVLSLLKMEKTIIGLEKKIQSYLPFVPPSLVEIHSDESDFINPSTTNATILICRMFLKENYDYGTDKIKMLKTYYDLVRKTVLLFNGAIYKYDNEEINIIFAKPFSLPEFELRATECAIEIQSAFKGIDELNNNFLSIIIHAGDIYITAFDMISSTENIIIGQTIDEINSLKLQLPKTSLEVIITEPVLEKVKNNFKVALFQPEGDNVNKTDIRKYRVIEAI